MWEKVKGGCAAATFIYLDACYTHHYDHPSISQGACDFGLFLILMRDDLLVMKGEKRWRIPQEIAFAMTS